MDHRIAALNTATSRRRLRAPLAACLLSCLALLPAVGAGAETIALDRLEHIHGLSVDREQPGRLYLATHSGLFLASPDGTAERIGDTTHDLMSFEILPGAGGFLASGHPPGGGNLGVLRSRDRGHSWEHLSAGADGPVDFHILSASPTDPETIYGLYKGLQMSRDGGRSWSASRPLPNETFDVAVSALDPGRLYAAARGGLFRSVDGGAGWGPVFRDQERPATLVHVATDGSVYAFVYGAGLVVSSPDEERWELRADSFADRYLLHLDDDPGNPGVMHALADTGAILSSRDGGRSWVSYAGHRRDTAERIASAASLYGQLCQSCHGENGVGERPEAPGANDEYGFVAPALDDSAHAWHHSDADLAQTILTGSPRNPRMLSFEGLLTPDDARDLVAYVKSLWSFRSLACQGARHMRCMH